MYFTTAALFALMGAVTAQKVHVVSVGSTNGTLAFSPDNLSADVGDMVQFQFRGGNHSVVQAAFDTPCSPINEHTNTTGIFSGYQPVAASQAMGMIPTYSVMVAAKTPMWFYCSQAKHCQSGMTMVLNENTAANATRSLANFKKLAAAATSNTAPSSASGGTASTNSTTGSTGSTGSGSSNSGTGAAATTSAAAAASSVATTGAATAVGVSSSMGLMGIVAALFML
ncbi:hypothetical protein F4804DRAFT_198684 [Jackrogersella minutella]|nr:hypothetical protein F4804DRAFT_198684 [Jackrogersella minutella]